MTDDKSQTTEAKSPKLTGPQIALLRETVGGPMSIHPDYKPAKRLAALGLVSVVQGSYGYHRLTITDAGRAAL